MFDDNPKIILHRLHECEIEVGVDRGLNPG
jgi:hypothetical protein